MTDNKRIVFSSGGITPDTVVQYGIENELVKDLLAKGLIFSFADKYYYENKNGDINKLSKEKLLSEFKKFLTSSNYKYESSAEKKIDEIEKLLDEKHKTQKMNDAIKKLQEQFSDLFSSDFESSKDEVTGELMAELAVRFSGNEAGIEEELKYDNQFSSALKLISDNSAYNSLLKNKL